MREELFVRLVADLYFITNADNETVGITSYTQRGHVARATLEATCFQTKAILDAMEKDSGHKLAELAVDGGMTNSDLCMQVRLPHIFTFPSFRHHQSGNTN
jgi:glycerol kinase